MRVFCSKLPLHSKGIVLHSVIETNRYEDLEQNWCVACGTFIDLSKLFNNTYGDLVLGALRIAFQESSFENERSAIRDRCSLCAYMRIPQSNALTPLLLIIFANIMEPLVTVSTNNINYGNTAALTRQQCFCNVKFALT